MDALNMTGMTGSPGLLHEKLYGNSRTTRHTRHIPPETATLTTTRGAQWSGLSLVPDHPSPNPGGKANTMGFLTDIDAPERRKDHRPCPSCDASAAGCRSVESLAGRLCCAACPGQHDEGGE